MAAFSGTPDRDLGARHAIPARGPPDHSGSGACPDARRSGCRLQQFQFTFKLVHRCDECSGNSAAVAQITANWEKFFNSSTSNSDRVALLQNGNAFSGAISGLISLAPGLGAKVINVTVNSATSATVTYNLTAGGTSLFTSSQTGKAVYENGVWKVGDASLCSLLQLVPGGTVPAACNSVS
jgi:hypothetical protein